MQSIKAAHNGPDDAIVRQLDGLGTALTAIHEVGAEPSIKADLLDQVVSIIRCGKTPDERVREIASLMRGLANAQRMRR
jgi:hypothetical protein